jgi:hypothetical protein
MSEDLSVFFQDSLITVPVVYGNLSATTGIFDQTNHDIGSGLVNTALYTLLMRTSDLATDPSEGDPLTVDGVNFTVNNFAKVDDGKLIKLELSKV